MRKPTFVQQKVLVSLFLRFAVTAAILLVSCSPVLCAAVEHGAGALEQAFVHPPDSARPWVYWYIMDGHLNRAGITADFEAMRDAGVGGMIMLEVNVGIPRGPVEYMSPQWQALFKHAVEEAERLGLEITLNAGPGWTGSGGPWVKAEQSMQHLVAGATEVSGPGWCSARLPRPAARPPYFGSGGIPEPILKAREDFYVDVAVLAFPAADDKERISDIDEKALYKRDPYSSTPNVKPYLPCPPASEEGSLDKGIQPSEIIDLTEQLRPDGRLAWYVPPGKWTVLRFGRRNNGSNTRPAPLPGLGFECDKLDPAALDAHFEDSIGKLIRAIGPRKGGRATGWNMLHIDSWEMGAQNWTSGFDREFERRRGYHPLPYLPVMTGRVVDNVEISERFLWDLRLTCQELVIENHARHLKKIGRRYGFGLSIEPYDMNPTSDLVLGGVADVPMCEFWSEGFGFDTSFSCFEAASIAHTRGRPIVAAEAFTANSGEAWKQHPGSMKDQGDWAFCAGVNRFVFHTFAHQPASTGYPGMTMGPYGVHWDRKQTFWPLVADYHRYLSRCQFLLRQGVAVADVCYLIPEGAPHVFRPPASALAGRPLLPDRKGYNFDGCAPQTLLDEATVKDGRLVLDGGAAYHLLVLPSFDTMTPALLRKIKQLVRAGVTVVGLPPRRAPGLSDYPACDRQVQNLARELWGDGETPPAMTKRRYGKGAILWGGLFRRPGQPLAERAIEKARWIWHPEEAPERAVDPGEWHFRRTVSLDPAKTLRAAKIEITADNAFTLRINGHPAEQGENFHQVFAVDAAPWLKPGENLIAVAARNTGDSPNPAGLIAALRVDYEDDSSSLVVTDGDWQASRSAEEGWKAAKDLGPASMDPWRLNTNAPAPGLYPGYVYTADILAGMGVPPDFQADGPIRYIHRRTGDRDIYFVSNRSGERVKATCRFRVRGKRPWLWDPVTGAVRPLPEFTERDGRLSAPLRFEPHQSFFVVCQAAGQPEGEEAAPRTNFATFTPRLEINTPWKVAFAPERGGPPDPVAFQTLEDWTSRPEAGIRYYSGTAVYRTRFECPPALSNGKRRVFLDVGTVHNLARVRLNGRDLGVLWCAPWRVDVTDALKAGENRLEIEVANLWPNRLIGDQVAPAEQRVTRTTHNPYRANDALLPSGLLGPVTLVSEDPS